MINIHYIKLSISIVLLLLVRTTIAQPYYGLPTVINYAAEEYNGGIQNYSIAQDTRGILYVGNNMGLLEYDGSSWNRYTVANQTKVRSVAIDGTGKIFVGAQNEFGYFFPNAKGQLIYNSLSNMVAEEDKDFGEVWRTYNTNRGIYFCTFTHIFRYENGILQTINIETPPLEFSFVLNEELYSQQRGAGMVKLENDRFEPVRGGEKFADLLVTNMIQYNRDKILVSTVDDGIYMYDGMNASIWPSPLQASLKEAKISQMIRLSNSNIAIGTESNGVFILSNDGAFVDHITKGNGLNNRTVLGLYEDQFNNLWVGMYNGIARISLNSPFTFINERLNLPGTGYASSLYQDQLFLGTNNGLFKYSGLQKPFTLDHNFITLVPNSKGQVYSLKNYDGSLFIGHHEGAFVLSSNQLERISDPQVNGWWKFLEIDGRPDILIAGTYSGLYKVQKLDGQWKVMNKIHGLDESSRVMEQDREGNIWMSHGYKGVFKFQLNEAMDSVKNLRFYNADDGFPSNLLINVFKVNNRLIFGSQQGIYVYDKARNRFARDEEFTSLLGPDILIRALEQDDDGDIYFIANTLSGLLKRDNTGSYVLENTLFNRVQQIFNDDLENIAFLDNENMLIGAKEGFVHYNPSRVVSPITNFTVLLRSVSLTGTGDSLIFAGNFTADDQISITQPENEAVDLSFDNNSIKFTFAATILEEDEYLRYRYFMEGFDTEWSSWSALKEKEYTNLREGSYVFHVVAKNSFNEESNELTYAFTINAPWYRTAAAYLIYFLLVISAIAIMFQLIKAKYKKDKRQAILEQQRMHIMQQNEFKAESQKTAQEIEALKNEKLKSELVHKNKELANSTMHLINKNEFISSVRHQLNSIAKKTSQAPVSKELQRIAKDINRNISSDEDWQQFEIHFDQVHGDFSKRLKAKYPRLSHQDLKLCAFLKLNMSTKEIANMLNITVRGVELSRYRLRKKLEIDRSVNLTEFVMEF